MTQQRQPPHYWIRGQTRRVATLKPAVLKTVNTSTKDLLTERSGSPAQLSAFRFPR